MSYNYDDNNIFSKILRCRVGIFCVAAAVLTFPEFHLESTGSEIPILKIEFGANDKDEAILAQHRFAKRKYDK